MSFLDLSHPVLPVGSSVLTVGDLLAIGGIVLLLLTAMMIFGLWRGAAARRREDAFQRHVAETRAQEAEQRLAELASTQSALAGRLAAMQEATTTGQAAFSQQMDERLARVQGGVVHSLTETTKATTESLTKLQERLAVIDKAQDNIQSLASNVVGLQNILSNKQARGAFAERRMEMIVRDGLPMGAFDFQTTLSNGTRCDCTIRMPNDQPVLVIDAKFPLEAWTSIRDAATDQEAKDAAARFNRDMSVHLKAISEKYLIAGETQETAFLFVPSESIFAEIHENFESIVQRAHKARVVIVSPSLLMLSVQVIQSVLKDARMREQAHLVQAEIMKFAADLSRLDDRVRKLKSHFDLTSKDIDQIMTSTDKLTRHGARIEALDFDETPHRAPTATSEPNLRAIDGGS